MRRRLSGSPVIFSSGAAMRNSPGWCRRAARPAQACVVTAEMPLSIPEAPTRARNGRSENFEIFATIRESRCRPLFRQLPCRQIVSSRQISNVAEKANRDAARCSLCTLGILVFIRQTRNVHRESFDFTGFLTLSLGIGALRL